MTIGDTDFGVQISIGVVGLVVTVIVAFLGSILLARILGPSDYGTFYLLMAVVGFLDNPITGWAKACRKRLTEADFPSGEVIGSTLIGIALTFTGVLVLAWTASPLITEYTGYKNGWLLLAFLFLGMVAYHASNEVLKSTERFGASPWLGASRDTIRVLFQSTFVLVGLGVAGMVGGMVLANLVVAPVVLYLIGIRPQLPSASTLRKIWSYARFSIPGGVVSTAQSRMDLILLGLLIGPSIAGNYEVAYKLTMPAMFVAGVAQGGLMGRISNLRSRGEEFSTDIQNNLAYASILAIPLFFGALTLAKPVVVTIYTNQYAEAAPLLVGLALFRLLQSQKSILAATIDGIDRPDVNFRVSAIVFLLNISLGVGLLLAIGPLGVVAATVVSEALAYSLRGYYVQLFVPSCRLFPREFLEQVTSGIIMGVIVSIARLSVPSATWPNVIFLISLGGITYFATLAGISSPFRSTALAVARDAGFR